MGGEFVPYFSLYVVTRGTNLQHNLPKRFVQYECLNCVRQRSPKIENILFSMGVELPKELRSKKKVK